jgi:hypothetical protein
VQLYCRCFTALHLVVAVLYYMFRPTWPSSGVYDVSLLYSWRNNNNNNNNNGECRTVLLLLLLFCSFNTPACPVVACVLIISLLPCNCFFSCVSFVLHYVQFYVFLLFLPGTTFYTYRIISNKTKGLQRDDVERCFTELSPLESVILM